MEDLKDRNVIITEENERMKREITNKAHILDRCTEAVCSTKNQMKIIKERYDEEIRIRDEKIKNIEKMEEEHREEKRLIKDELKLVGKGKRELAKNITEVKKQINELKERRAKHEKTIIMSGEDNRKVMDLIDENNKLKKSIYLTRTEGRNLENNTAEHEEQTSRNGTTELKKQTSE